MSVSYFQLLTSLIAFAVQNPELFRRLWAQVVAAYHTTVELVNGVREALPDVAVNDGTLSMTAATDEELDAEDRLAAVLYPHSQTMREPGQFRKIVAWLATSEIGKALFAELMKRAGL